MHTVAWTVMGLLLAVVVAIRLATRRGRRQIWWVCATLGPATGIAAGIFFGNTAAVDAFFGTPNIAILLATLATLTGACCLFIFWHAVRHESPHRLVISAHLGVAVLLAVLIIGNWATSPVYDRTYASPRDIPLSDPRNVGASLICIGYYAAAQAVTAIFAYQALRRPPGHDAGFQEPALRAALIIVIPSAVVYLVGQLAWATAYLSYFTGLGGRGAFAVGDLLMMMAMAGYAAMGITVLAGPRLHRHIHSRRLLVQLSGLWRRIRELYPAIALPLAGTPSRPYLRAQRMLIEIADGLTLLPVPATAAHPEPINAVARALAHPGENVGLPAAAVLPAAETRRQEEELFSSIAEAYAAAITADADPGRPCSQPTGSTRPPTSAAPDARPDSRWLAASGASGGQPSWPGRARELQLGPTAAAGEAVDPRTSDDHETPR
jgi:hypothetical protein